MKLKTAYYGVVTEDSDGFEEMHEEVGTLLIFAIKKRAVEYTKELVSFEDFNTKNRTIRKARVVKLEMHEAK